MSAPDAPLPTAPARAPGPSLHGNDQQVVEKRSLRDYYVILRERLWIALPVALLVALSIGYYQAQEIPMYSSTATMQFERPERVVQNEQVVDTAVRSEVDLGTYLQILQSGRLRTMVAQSLTPDEIRLLQRPYLKDLAPGANPPAVGGLLGSMSPLSIRNSFLITITVNNRDPEGAALLANRFVEQFMRYLMENVGGKNEFAVDYLRSRAKELQQESEAAEGKLQDYRRKHNLVSLDNSMNIVGERLRTVNATLTTARLARLDIETLLSQIEKMQKENPANLLEIGYISAYGNIPVLKNNLAELNKQQAILSERYLERHPKMIELANSIDVVTAQITRNIEQSISDLRTQYVKLQDTEASYIKEYQAAEKDNLRLGDLSVDFKSLENQAQVAKSNYLEILNRLNQVTTSKNLENIPVKPLDRALPKGSPDTPNIRNIVKTSIGLGLVVFAGVAIGLSFLDDRVKSAWDIEGFIGAHLLGIIPELGDVPDTEKHSLVNSNRTSPGSEAFLSVYSAVKIQSKLDFPKSILVTSTIPGEGKTMISCNLAGSFARHGKKVLLIDCDMRRPMLHRHFKLTNEAGLIAWFEAGAKIPADPFTDASLGFTKVDENLFLLRSGGRSKSPTELLETAVFGQFIEAMKQHFDLIVVDSPPMGAVTDSLLIAERTDEVIYVCRFNRAYRKHIRLYIKQLKESKNELLGIVLNGLSPRRIEYYSNYRYYRSYKKYYGSQS
ncbi:polysaccharide biosynthesis tyrosine autokinase [Opitutus sp. GAS368]|jgi:succinoglycan biosynthesis transport protein ExoP|uniref:GumC family protein n=1 Tax=Opitutus sp. GAS368 TaxID=1882749 RepID=UPI0008793C56|nr:polysaccharide biosynthesis tyrosine autokinase [Opitutus sp. GAS368]SDS52444.1 capsular exopolysaccharide family [Opitutus sp. GAS368]